MDEHSLSHETPTPPPVKVGVLRSIVRVIALLGLAFALHKAFVWAEGWIAANDYGWAMPGLLIAVLVIYAILIAIPFVPGIEIGLMVLAAGGASIAPLV